MLLTTPASSLTEIGNLKKSKLKIVPCKISIRDQCVQSLNTFEAKL